MAAFMAPALTSYGASPELAAVQEKFTSYLAKLNDGHADKTLAWERAYLDALQSFVRQAQTTGDLENLLHTKKELARFERIPALTPRTTAGIRGGFRPLAERYLASYGDIALSHSQSIKSLFESYDKSLERLESRLTTAGSLDAAVDVRNARKRGVDNEAVRRAQFEMAAAGVVMPAAPSAIVSPDREDAAAVRPLPPRTDEMAPQPQHLVVHGVSIYRSGSAEREDGVTFRRLTLNRTPRAPAKSSWGVSAQMANADRAIPSSGYKTKVYGRRLRVSFKASLTMGGEQDVMVVTQYFHKPAMNKGTVAPRLALTRRTPLSFSAGDSVLLDYPLFEAWSARVSGGRTYGEEFYGVVVSVFDSDKTLIYQSASARGLYDLARTDMPGPVAEESVSAMRDKVGRAQRSLIAARGAVKNSYKFSIGAVVARSKAVWRLGQARENLRLLEAEQGQD